MTKKYNPDELLFVPLGGAEQFGANLNVYGYKGKWLAVDMGIGFADEYYPGVDILLPNPKFLEAHKEDICGLIITHAHEDHIGGVAHLWPRLKCPIYCTEFTAIILKKKMAENPECRGAKIHIIDQQTPVKIAPFTCTFLPVTHSVPNTSSILIETDLGNVLHSGDWNLDPRPVLGDKTDEAIFRKIGDDGVLAYVGDSTNAGVNGFSGSESDVEEGLSQVFKDRKGRIVITIFSSNIGRVRSICKAAAENDRHVAVLGRSLHRMIGAATDCGYLDDIENFIEEEDIGHLPNDKVVIIATGSQGEARAQVGKIARGDHKNLKLDRGDTVIFSSRAIPGNEKEINFVQNRLAGSGIDVINPRDTEHCIHVSGHPARDEIKLMYDWVRPQIVVPVHGEKIMLQDQAELARNSQISQVVVPSNGTMIRLAPNKPEIIDHVETGLLAVEPGRIIASGHKAISERRKLQYSGTMHISVVIDRKYELIADPQITTVGLFDDDVDDIPDFEDDLSTEIEDLLHSLKRSGKKDVEYLEEQVRIMAMRYVFDILRIKPKVNVHLMKV